MTELVSSLGAKAIEKLGFRVYQEISSAYGVESDLEKLRQTMSDIQVYLLDAEERQGKNGGVSNWLGRLKVVFYEAMNVLDAFDREDLRRQVMKTHESTSREVRRFFSSSNPALFRFKMARRIKKIRESLEEIKKDKAFFSFPERHDDRPVVPGETEIHCFFPVDELLGRSDDMQKIIDLLINSSDVDNVSVISICGLVGIGKTTLAEYVYRDERVAGHFQYKLWVDISESEDLNTQTLARKILNSLRAEGIDCQDVQKALKGIRFFMVLDNVRAVDVARWDKVKHFFMEAAKGSKIVVTTSYQNVAKSSKSKSIYVIESLSDNDCFSLLLRRAFEEGEEQKYPKLVEIGEEIVKKCKGVPLAVMTLGDLLYCQKKDHFWAVVRDTEICKLGQEIWQQEGRFILPSLKLSYDQLPPKLKPVFAHLSLYPKDYKYSSIELIQSLMANGLLGHRSETMEATGTQYLEELCARFFFKEVKGNYFSFTFKIHDLMHELSRFVTKDDHCLIGKNDGKKNYKGARHVSIFYDSLGASDEAESFLHKLSNGVSTIIFRNEDEPLINVKKSVLKKCISRCKYMRLLDLSLVSVKLPSSIRTLKLLRYLSLQGNTQIKKLPNSICDLQNLETLLLAGCKELEELPRDIRKMMSLRYLSITTKQTCLPDNGIECLPSLRTLIFVDCPKLESLPNNVMHFTTLRSLEFRSCDSLMSLPQVMRYMVALETLTIVGCGKLDLMTGEDYPTSLQSLVTGELPQLVDLPKLVKESAGTLKFLDIYDCGNLDVLPDWVTQLTSLQRLQFRKCPKLRRYCDQEVPKDWPKIEYIDCLSD